MKNSEKSAGQAHSALRPIRRTQGKQAQGSGQALIEILVALTVMVLVATAFVTLGVVTVRNSSFSQNKTRATQLAQEGIEAVIAIRDQNGPIQNFASATFWQGLYLASMSCGTSAQTADLTQPCGNDFILQEPSVCPPTVGPPPSPQRCISNSTSPYTASAWQVSANTAFSRKIRITNTADPSEATTVRAVNVFVWWTDSQGLHKALVSRKVHKNRLTDLMYATPAYGTPAGPTPTPQPSRVFVTSDVYTYVGGNIGGLSGADFKCNMIAGAQGLGGTWKAWMSTTTISAVSRLYHSTVPYKLLNGTTIANNWDELISGTLRATINIDEASQQIPVISTNFVWTGTGQDGSSWPALTDTCNNWTDQSFTGVFGRINITDGRWTNDGGSRLNCTQSARLYCFEQAGAPGPTPTPTTGPTPTSGPFDSDGDGVIDASDCSPADPTRWQNLSCFVDSDNDTYTVGGAVTACKGASCTSPSGHQTAASLPPDCYDLNSDARPGQVIPFSTTRGTSQRNDSAGNPWDSYDYNCDGSYTLANNCLTTLSAPICATAMPNGFAGWFGSIPACGSAGTWRDCGLSYSDASCTIVSGSTGSSCGAPPCQNISSCGGVSCKARDQSSTQGCR